MISRAQIPLPTCFVAGETTQEARRNPTYSYPLGTGLVRGAADVPDDPALLGLAWLHRPEQFLAALTPLLRSRLGSHIELAHKRLLIRRYVPGKRCVVKVEATMRDAPGIPDKPRCFLAKFYTGGQGARVYRNCRELWRRGFSRGCFTISEPLAYHSAWQVLILGWENGASLRDIVLTRKDPVRVVEGAAKWLHHLHTCGFTGGRVYHFSRHLDILGACRRRLASEDRETGRAFGHVLHRIERRLRKCGPLVLAPTHRDFSPEHIIVEGQRFTGLDFDEFCQYDPQFDVAHFVAHLRFLALTSLGTIDSLDDLVTHFESSYASQADGFFSASRMRLFAAIAYLKLAYVEAVVRRNRDGKQVAETLLEEALRFSNWKD